jgi:hypothetical protein
LGHVGSQEVSVSLVSHCKNMRFSLTPPLLRIVLDHIKGINGESNIRVDSQQDVPSIGLLNQNKEERTKTYINVVNHVTSTKILQDRGIRDV